MLAEIVTISEVIEDGRSPTRNVYNPGSVLHIISGAAFDDKGVWEPELLPLLDPIILEFDEDGWREAILDGMDRTGGAGMCRAN